MLWTYDSHRVNAALPTLLPQLGIPSDAVGIVVREQVRSFTGNMIIPESGAADGLNATSGPHRADTGPAGQPASRSGIPAWAAAGAAALVLVILGPLVFLGFPAGQAPGLSTRTPCLGPGTTCWREQNGSPAVPTGT